MKEIVTPTTPPLPEKLVVKGVGFEKGEPFDIYDVTTGQALLMLGLGNDEYKRRLTILAHRWNVYGEMREALELAGAYISDLRSQLVHETNSRREMDTIVKKLDSALALTGAQAEGGGEII